MVPLHSMGQQDDKPQQVRIEPQQLRTVKVDAERLPDLNVPRVYNAVFFANGELTVTGGHTTGFIPTPTAEYLSDGKWHLMEMAYRHDNGITVPLQDGRVLLAGGLKDNLGIGQSFEVEMYNPENHSFTGFGCLSKKRALASGVEIDSGRVVIAGNWYADDGIEVFDGTKKFTHVKDVSSSRRWPFMFRTSDGDVMVFGNYDAHGQKLDTIVVDRLKGESFIVPLFKEWYPMTYFHSSCCQDCFIGDESKNRYAYLIPAKDFADNGWHDVVDGRTPGQMSIILVEDTVFSLLPTEVPIPMTSHTGKNIFYEYSFLVDRKAQRAYLLGADADSRLYVIAIDYAKRPAPLTLYYTDPLPDCGFGSPVLTEDGDMIIAGGMASNGIMHDNYKPVATVFLIHIGNNTAASVHNTTSWIWLLLAVLALAAIIVVIVLIRKKHRQSTLANNPSLLANNNSQPATHSSPLTKEELQTDEEMTSSIRRLMEDEQMFLDPDLKLADVAEALGTNPRIISVCIRNSGYSSFNQFVNNYRVAYAQQLLREQPDRKMYEVYTAAGFSSESSFFRVFKAVTGKTPSEWNG